jgi:hypothetical protein
MTKKIQIPQALQDAISDDNLILFVGSGLSLKFGMPNWKALAEIILNDLKTIIRT